MKLQLVTLLGEKLNQDVHEVMLDTESGEIAVFPGHEPLVTLVKPGVIAVRLKAGDSDEQLNVFASSGGIAEINGDMVRILVDEAAASDDITESEANAALERAEKLRAEAGNQVELERANELVDRAAVRLKVAGLRRRRR